jgi:hypothetical protein
MGSKKYYTVAVYIKKRDRRINSSNFQRHSVQLENDFIWRTLTRREHGTFEGHKAKAEHNNYFKHIQQEKRYGYGLRDIEKTDNFTCWHGRVSESKNLYVYVLA